MSNRRIRSTMVSFLAVLLAGVMLLASGCTQYEYSSPQPGVVQVRLKTISNPERLPFDPRNNFVLKVNEVTALRDDLARGPIYGDVKAIGRTTGVYNTLDHRARDSSLIIGEGHLPPGNYLGILMLIEPGTDVFKNGYNRIPVRKPPRFDSQLKFSKPFRVDELRTTRITLTIDLDQSLLERIDQDGVDYFLFSPLYYISSIEYE